MTPFLLRNRRGILMPFVQNGQIKLYYEEHGHGQAIIMINDLVEDHLFWKKILKDLSKHFRVIVFDQRGMGQSTVAKSSFTVEDMALDVIAIADKLELEKFHLVGDSMGGVVAQVIARKHKDRIDKLVLSNSYTHLTQVIQWSLEITCEIFKEHSDYNFLYKMLMPWYFSSRFLERDDDPKEILDALKKRKHPLTYKGFKNLVEAVKDYNSTKMLKYIKSPTLVIIAEEDIFCLFRDSRQMVKAIPEHKVELIGGGHNSKLEHPNRYSELVRNFFLGDQ